MASRLSRLHCGQRTEAMQSNQMCACKNSSRRRRYKYSLLPESCKHVQVTAQRDVIWRPVTHYFCYVMCSASKSSEP